MTMPRIRRSNIRAISLLLLIGVLMSACSGAFENKDQGLTEISGEAPVLPSMMAGYTQTQLDTYTRWFRSSNSGEPPAIDGGAVRYLNPSCPLQLDYTRMLPEDSLVFPDVRGNVGYYNPAKQEMLVVLAGQSFGSYETADGGGLSCGNPLYLPLRVNLGTGSWQIDGYTTPGSTIQIAVTGSHEIVPLNGDGDLGEDTTEIVSPMRLNRFVVTDENFERVMRYASISRRSGAGRHIVWFRNSDINPVYARLATGNCDAGYYAFWSSGGDGGLTPCGVSFDFGADDDNPHWLDEFARMNGSGGKVWEKRDDDSCGLTGSNNDSGACQLDNDGWKEVAGHLTALVSNGNRGSSFAALADLLDEYGALADNTIPDEMGGWENPDDDIFGVIVANGRTAYDQTRSEVNDDETLHRWVGFTGKQECSYDPCGATYSITVTSSFQYTEVEADEDAARVYNATSLINGGRMRVQPFSSADSAEVAGSRTGLAYEQSPLAQVQITVTDPLNAGHTNVYTTEWLPLWAMGRNAGDMTYQTTMDWFGDPLGSMSQMVYEMFYQIYRATFGNWVSGLSQAATSWLVSVPQLEEYAIAYYDSSGQPVYQINKELIRTDLVTRLSPRGGLLENEFLYDTSKLSGDTKVCTEAVLFGSLDPSSAAHEPCFERNQLFDLWFWLRGLAWIFLLGHIFLYGYRLLTLRSGGKMTKLIGGSDRTEMPMSPTQFAARVVIAFALIEGMSIILFVLQSVVGEVLIVTNLIGTRVGGGEPYSHLWLFNTFLTTPPRGADVLGLFVLAIPTLVGLIVLMMVGWLRYGITLLLLLLTPFWALWLLGERSPARFYWSLKLMLRMYLLPLLTLVVLLLLFVSMRMLGIGPGTNGGVVGALLSFLMLLAVAIVPIMLSKMVFAGVLGAVENGIARITKQEGTDQRNALVNPDGEHRGSIEVHDGGAANGMGQLSREWDAGGNSGPASFSGQSPSKVSGSISTDETVASLGSSAKTDGGDETVASLGSSAKTDGGDALNADNEKLFGPGRAASLGARLRDKASALKEGAKGQISASKKGIWAAAKRSTIAGFAGAAWTTAGMAGVDKANLTGAGIAGAAKSALSYGSLRGALGEAVAISGVNHAWAAAPPWMAGAGSKGLAVADGWGETAHGAVASRIAGAAEHKKRFGALTDTWQESDAAAAEAQREYEQAQAARQVAERELGSINIDDGSMRAIDEKLRALDAEEKRLNDEIAAATAIDTMADITKQSGAIERLEPPRVELRTARADMEARFAPALKARAEVAARLSAAQDSVARAQTELETKEQMSAAAYAALRTMTAATPLMKLRSAGFAGAGESRERFGRELADAAEKMAMASVAAQASRQEYGSKLIDDGSIMAREIEKQVIAIEAEMRNAAPAERGAVEDRLNEQRTLATALTGELRKFVSEAGRHSLSYDQHRLDETLRTSERHAASNVDEATLTAARETLETQMSSYAAAAAAAKRAEDEQHEAARAVASLERTADIRRGANIAERGTGNFDLARREHLTALKNQANSLQEAERGLAQRVEALRAQTSAAETRGFDAKLRATLTERRSIAESELERVRRSLETSVEEAERVGWRAAASW